ncbi:MAG: DNA double-strand break repair nuclease NurA [Candidatus Diapherotrites archaeon]|nr:DNA double-strand break repair nuclease NurA [Candidatus Diapherotrites archaeon]
MFIDGSIVPQYQDKPRGDSELNSDYHSIITLFARLYKVAEQNFTTLVACVEDSRGTRFRQILQDDILSKDSSSTPSSQNSLNQKNLSSKIQLSASILNSSFDASILDYYLRQGERTFAFSYTNSPSSHAILKDYSPEWAKSVFVFYLKATEFDRPLRVEFLCKDKNNLKECANRIASIVYSLSSLHREYSFPSILIEADLRAGLSEQEINVVYERLIDKLGSKIRMRRNNRPFG